MAFVGVEFCEDGGLAVVRSGWLTPRKREVLWPPYKDGQKFRKALLFAEDPNENSWKCYQIKRRFFETDDLDVANRKIQKLEETSDIGSESESSCRLFTSQKQKGATYRLADINEISESENEDCNDTENEITENLNPSTTIPRPPSIEACVDRGNANPNIINVNRSASRNERSLNNRDQSQTPLSSFSGVFNFLPNISKLTDNLGLVTGDRIITLLLEIKEQNSQILEFLKKEKVPQSNLDFVHTLPCSLPIKSEEDLEIFEDFLKDNEKLAALVTYLSSLGGRDLVPTTNRILKTLLSDQMASFYNFCGKKNKKPFRDLQIKTAVLSAVRTSSNVKEREIEDIIKVWLKHAPQRLKAASLRR